MLFGIRTTACAYCRPCNPVASTLAIGLLALISGCESTRQPAGDPLFQHKHAASLVRELLAAADASTKPKALNPEKPEGEQSIFALADAPAVRAVHKRDNHWLSHRVSLDAASAPLEGLLLALAGDASVELDLQETLAETVTLRVEDQPLSAVLKLLSRQASFRWSATPDRLVVFGAGPYTMSYNVEYLNIDRTTHSSVGLATQVGTINANDGAGQGSGANNSRTLVENHAEHRFWASLETDLAALMSVTGSGRLQDAGYGRSAGRAETEELASGRALTADGIDAPARRFTINRDAGLVTVHAEVAMHERLQNYLAKLNDSVRRQVLIEATVVEVTLSNSYAAGVDWQLLAKDSGGLSAVQRLPGAPLVNADTLGRLGSPGGLVSLVQQNRFGDIGVTLSLLERFGDVRILSRPRIIALNNQSSVLKVVDNRVYFTLSVERQRSEEKDEIITETEIHTVPVGLVMNVTPFIGQNDDVMLNVRPTLSRILGFVDDPNPELAAANVRNSVPEIQVREMESMLRVASGDMAIIGGLMQESVDNASDRLPGIGGLPILRHLFSSRERKRRQTELLIVLRPTVLSPDGEPSSLMSAAS